MTFAELERRAEAVGWKVLEWADGDLTVELNDDVDVTAHADDREEATRRLLPWLGPVLQAAESRAAGAWEPSGAPGSGPLRDAFLEVQRRKREVEIGEAPPDIVATVKRKLAVELPGQPEERLDKLVEITIGGMLWVAKMLADHDLSLLEGWGVAESMSDALKDELGDGITPHQGVEAGVGAGLYTGIWMGLLLAGARELSE